MALHQRQRQSCSRRTLPQFLSHTTHLALTGRLPSSHWWGINTWDKYGKIPRTWDINWAPARSTHFKQVGQELKLSLVCFCWHVFSRRMSWISGYMCWNTKHSFITHPFLILNDIISYGGQRGPFAVVGGANGTALVSLELTNCRGEIDECHVRHTYCRQIL